MEDVIIEKEITQESKDLVINQEMQNHLMIYAKWGKFFGVLAYVGAVLMIGFAVLYLFIPFDLNGVPLVMLIRFFYSSILVACSILYFIGGRLMIQSANSTKIGIIQNNQTEIEKGTKKLASLMSFMGIVTIVGICIYFIFMTLWITLGYRLITQIF